MSDAHYTAWITFFAEQATGVTLILWNILLPIKIAISWCTSCAIHCVTCVSTSTGMDMRLSTAGSLNLCASSADFERWLINHLNSIDLSKSTTTPDGTGAIVMCGWDAWYEYFKWKFYVS